MAQKFIAEVQYNDLKGTVAADGYDSPPLFKISEYVKLPSEYWPVGLSFSKLDPDNEGNIPFVIYAVDKNKVGENHDEIQEFLKNNNYKLTVEAFNREMPITAFGAFFKRLDIKMLQKEFDNADIEIKEGD
jgi:hypothetical protein